MATRKSGSRRPKWFPAPDRLRAKRRRQDRKGLLQALEQRQLLAGPDLIGIQPNEGSLLQDQGRLTVQPRELVFNFDDATEIDPATLDGIKITRSGGDGQFERAQTTFDFGTGGSVLVLFRAVEPGVDGNGLTLNFTTENRVGSALPRVSVTDKTIDVNLNSNPAQPSTVAGLINVLANDAAASGLVEAVQVSGASLSPIGTTTNSGSQAVLQGANVASAVTDLGTGGAVRVRVLSAITGPEGRGQQLVVEQRNFLGPAQPAVIVRGTEVTVQVNSAPGNETTVSEFITAINSNPQASALLTAELQAGSPDTVIGDVAPTYSPLALSGASDITVEPGYVGLGSSPREVVFRFAEPLPDDTYQISILGNGPDALLNVDGEAFGDGVNESLSFTLDLGPQVLAVVPEPMRRVNGSLSPEVGLIEVHFNQDDLDVSLAETPEFYQLYYSRGTANTNDDILLVPDRVDYDAVTNIARLRFPTALARVADPDNPGQFLTDGVRLRVGRTDQAAHTGNVMQPTEVAITVADPGDSFSTAFDVGMVNDAITFSGEVVNTAPYGLNLPAGPEVEGTRNLRPEDPTRLSRVVPLDYLRNPADRFDGISTVYYDFAPSWLGDDPNSPGIDNETTYFNVITEEQKQRVREALHMFSEYLGIQFVETNGAAGGDAFFTIAVGDLYGGDTTAVSSEGGLAVVTRDRNGDGVDDLGVLDFQDFDESTDDQYGGKFFRGAMLVIGQMLGYGFADDLPQPVTQSTEAVFNPGDDAEPSFPSAADIVNGQYLYRPESADIDLYEFQVGERSLVSIQSFAERLSDVSLLDTHLRLYQQQGTEYVEIAANDDYFSRDSLIELELDAGTYMLGVSASGNDEYDPVISGTGFGGTTEGAYELRIDVRPTTVDAGAVLTDSAGNLTSSAGAVAPVQTPLDGDNDGRPGGLFNFWFVPSDPTTTIFVDKAAPTAGSGTISAPYRNLQSAVERAQPGQTIRVLANGGDDGLLHTKQDNLSYQIGFDALGNPLPDGSSLDVPQGVTLVVDAGAIFKMKASRVGIGSTSPSIDRSGGSLQLLGTPTLLDSSGRPVVDGDGERIPGSVIFTSFNDDSVGAGNTPAFTPAASPGDWGGLDFRGDVDAADETRTDLEAQGLFLNRVQFADLRFGGGRVNVDGRSVVVSPVDMATSRVTVANSSITHSADAAIAATPDTFAETRFDEPEFQGADRFIPAYDRVGPDIFGNAIIENSINGLFLRVVTRTGSELQPLTAQARFDDIDIPHILTENLVVEATPGGALADSTAPPMLLVRTQPTTGGDVPAGTYSYRMTYVDASGQESIASAATGTVTLGADGAIRLTQLPTVPEGGEFVSRRLYRAAVTTDPATGDPVTGPFQLVGQLNASSRTFTDGNGAPGETLVPRDQTLRARFDARLAIDPGMVIKLDSARIEARFGADVLAEGTESLPIVFTSLEDQRYGGSGTFDTNDRGTDFEVTPGDWGGLYIGQGSQLSLDHAVIAAAGGVTRIEGGFAAFNPIEVHQGDLRLANSRLEFNADGQEEAVGDRVGRGTNAPGGVFVRSAMPIIVGNDFISGEGAPISIDVNSLGYNLVSDLGRSRGGLDQVDSFGNAGPLVRQNRLGDNETNGMQVRGGQLTTQGVWDDYDIVHVVRDTIEVPNQFVYGGLQLRSDARGSLVVKFQNDVETAGIVVGGNLLTAETQMRDIADRIGGSLQLVGQPDFPVVLTTLADDFAGAGFAPDGRPQMDTNNDGLLGGDLGDSSTGPPRLPTGPEVNNGLFIDNDVDPQTPGYFATDVGDGGQVFLSGFVTVRDVAANQVLVNQQYIFAHDTYIDVGGTVTNLAATNITQPATLIADDRVQSQGNFDGPNGQVDWTIESYFLDGVATLYTTLDLQSAAGGDLGDIDIINYLDEDVELPNDDILYTVGTPGQADFRAYTIDGNRRVGFSHGGFYSNDGINQSNAQYIGWTADEFPDLDDDIQAGDAQFSIPGVIDVAALPVGSEPGIGTVYGPGDVTTAFAWRTEGGSSSSRVTSFLELLPEDPTISGGLQDITPGLWEGVVVREAASNRNVAAFTENESVEAISPGTNALAGQAQFLGELAPSEKAGDENRRLGFVVDGQVARRDDVDVYSFIGEAGTQVWFDIDRTDQRLDSVVELVDANGQVLARSVNSLAEERAAATGTTSTLFASDRIDDDAVRPMSEIAERTETQVLTVGGNIASATGFLNIGLTGSPETATIAVEDFLADPARAVQLAINQTFAADLGVVDVSLRRRASGADYVFDIRFDNDLYLGSDVANLLPRNNDLTIAGGGTVALNLVEAIDDNVLQDAYSTNPRDAGMRVLLPGEGGTRNLYHVRVRSSNAATPADLGNLADPSRVRDGLTSGSYRLQVRLREADETPGTQLRFSDVRFASTGLNVIGQPFHSPLLGEEHEQSAANDTFDTAQPLGAFGVSADQANGQNNGPLSSDRLAKSVAGTLDGATDIDWYQFDVQYERLTRDNAAMYLATVFDLDYADNYARADMAFYIFDEAGNLIMTAGDSNIADDQPRTADSVDSTDLSRGSAGTLDPYLGTAELSEGTYFIAVANQTQIPQQMDQLYSQSPTNPLLRLEPIDSVRRIAEDRIDFSGGTTADAPQLDVLFDPATAAIDHTLNDVILYTIGRTGNGNEQTVNITNPFTGENYGSVGLNNQDFADFAFLPNGELFSYNRDVINGNPPNDDGVLYQRISSETGAATVVGTTGLETFEIVITDDGPEVVESDEGVHPEAITFRDNGLGFFVGNRVPAPGPDYLENIVYQFDPQTGEPFSGAVGDRVVRTITVGGEQVTIDERANGAGTQVRERGYIETGILDSAGNPLNPNTVARNQFVVTEATQVSTQGVTTPLLRDQVDTFTIFDVNGTPFTFELDSGPEFTFQHDDEADFAIRDGDQFSVTSTGGTTVYEFNTGPVLTMEADQLVDGNSVTLTDRSGVERTFEFDSNGAVADGAIAVPLQGLNGARLTDAELVDNLASAISQADFAIEADATTSLGRISFTGDSESSLPSVQGAALDIEGDYDVTPDVGGQPVVEVRLNETASRREFGEALVRAVGDGVVVSHAGNRINFRGATAVDTSELQIRGIITGETGAAGVQAGRTAVPFSVADRADDIAIRVAQAINNAGLGSVTATPNGRNVTLSNATVTRGSIGSFEVVGVSPGGRITGIAFLGNTMYAVSNQGGLYVVNNPTGHFEGNIGTYVSSATDLVGIPFTGLSRGPRNVDGGQYADLLFGTTAAGEVYAFDSAGRLQDVFVGGQSMIDIDGAGGVRGVAFSTLDYNLWHVTDTRGEDPGHGINPNFNGTREGVEGGNSLHFAYQDSAFGGLTSPAQDPLAVPRQDGQQVANTYNFPGGAFGAIESNRFDLAGYSADDEPMLYFNYFLESDNETDAFRVYVIAEDGVEHLVATNASARGPFLRDDEYDDPDPFDDVDVDVQEVFDNSDSWRQARVPLSEFAGGENLRLRVEFSSAGQIGGTDPQLRVLPGEELFDGQQIVVNGEVFRLTFGPTIVTPSGRLISDYYDDVDGGVPGSAPNARVTVDVGGVTFVLNDGQRNVDESGGEVDVRLFDPATPGATPLGQLTADDIATALATAIEANPPEPTLNEGMDFSDETNDQLSTATPITLPAGDATLSGTGNIQVPQDVDLFRLDLPSGATLELSTAPTTGSALTPLARLFDAQGNEMDRAGLFGLQYTADADETVYVGVSSNINGNYNPVIAGSGVDGDTGAYTLDLNVTRDFGVIQLDNRIEVTGGYDVALTADSPLRVDRGGSDAGIPIHVNSGMTAVQVADAIRQAMARQFTGGQLTAFGTSGSAVTFAGLTVEDPGPFGLSTGNYGDEFGTVGAPRARDNAFEGVYFDDIIIGFAERGELVTGANVDTALITDPSPNLTLPAQPVSDLTTGSYQLEIRDASEYVASQTGTLFRSFDTNDRLAASQTISARPATQLFDGSTFTIGDGNATVTFEFNLVESDTGVTPGNVEIPYTFEAIEPGTATINPATGQPVPGTGQVRPQTAEEVAASIVAAINSPEVQLLLDVSAAPSSGLNTIADSRINLLGTSLVDNTGGGLQSVVRASARGDENRDRDAQGVVLVENSRFLFNSEYGVDLNHGLTAEVAGVTTDTLVRYPRNLVELNTEAFVPGVVVQSNVLAFNSAGGVRVQGIDNGATDLNPVPFDRIVNNTIIGGSVTPGVSAPAETINGVDFPSGAISFADRVVSYNPGAGGGPEPDAEFQDPTTAIGRPDREGRGPEPETGDFTVSMGNRGTLVLEFIDNRLTGSGNANPDLVVFEAGDVESVLVEVSRDGVTFFEVGIVDGLTNMIDIDAAGFGVQDRFAFVRLTDLGQGQPGSSTIGADIDAVGAISNATVDLYVPGGDGVVVVDNAAPTLLNNVIANSEVGIELDATTSAAVLGGTTFYRNTAPTGANANLGTFAQVVPESEEMFVGAGELIFTPGSGASIIDASIDSLEDRASLVTVRQPLGLPSSPIIAPRFDVNGQLRVDDPSVESPFGSGELVFKDRGAEDRGDNSGPRVVLTTPRAAAETGTDAGVVRVANESAEFFEVQLVDGIAPSDPVPGVGIDDRSVTGNSLLLLENGVPLVEGVDYRFGYNPSTNTIRLTPLAGVFRTDSVYVIRLLDSGDAVLRGNGAAATTDGSVFRVTDQSGATTSFEYETGIQATVPQTLPEVIGTDGATFSVTDGALRLTFELDDDGQLLSDAIGVTVPSGADTEVIAAAIADAINATALQLTAVPTGGGGLTLVGTNPLSLLDPLTSGIQVRGAIGTSVGFGLQIPVDLAVPEGIEDGQTFVIRRGAVQEVVFEFDNNGVATTDGAVRVAFDETTTLEELSNRIVAAIAGSGLGLNPINAGAGRIALQGDVTYTLDVSNTVLTQIGQPGETATVPVPIPAGANAEESADAILAAIHAADLPGVSASRVGARVLLNGASGLIGAGVVDLVTIRDEVGNLLQSNQPDGSTELTIFVGTGFDYGDAPAPYASMILDGGPARRVDDSLTLGATVSADPDARLPDADNDDGVSFAGSFQRGFTTPVNIDVQAGQQHYAVDVLVDWNQDGDFDDASETLSFGSVGNPAGRTPLLGSVLLQVPQDAAIGTTYARFVLTGMDSTGALLETGEIEDWAIQVQANEFQNPVEPADVNNSGVVTPLDALQIINALNRYNSMSIPLTPRPANIPEFPDVDGDGFIRPADALRVIFRLNQLYREGAPNGGQGEDAAPGANYMVRDDGLLAGMTTHWTDQMEAAAHRSMQTESSEIPEGTEKVSDAGESVFDPAATVRLGGLIDTLASDREAVSESEESSEAAIDAWFAGLGQ